MDYLKHLLIRTPLEAPARKVQARLQRRSPPELAAIDAEPALIETALARVLRKDACCVDVGCHLGSMMSQFLRLAPKGRHVGVEPIPKKAAWLRKKFPEAKIIELAASDHPGEVEFFINRKRSGFSGLKRHGDNGDDHVRIAVRQGRLDDELAGSARLDFLKVDVEGAELAALRGARTLLELHRPVVLFECTASGLAAHDVSAADLYGFFREGGFELFLIGEWLTAGDPLSLRGFEAAQRYPFRAFNFLAVPVSLA